MDGAVRGGGRSQAICVGAGPGRLGGRQNGRQQRKNPHIPSRGTSDLLNFDSSMSTPGVQPGVFILQGVRLS